MIYSPSVTQTGSVNIKSFENYVINNDWFYAIQKAIDSGLDVFIPSGSYYISDTIKPNSNQKIYGSGLLESDPYKTIIDVGLKENVTIEGISLTQNVTSDWNVSMLSVITDFSGPSNNVILKNLYIYNTGFFGVFANSGSTGWLVDGCYLYRTGRDGIDIRGGYGHRIVNNYAVETGDDAFVITNVRIDNVTYEVSNSVISNNTAIRPGFINLGGSGVRVAGRNIVVSNNVVESPNYYGIVVSSLDADGSVKPSNVVVSSNVVRKLNKNKVDGSGDPVAVAALLIRDVVNIQSNNNIWDCQGDDVDLVGSAYLIRNNTNGGSQNDEIQINNDTVLGAFETVRNERYNTRSIVISGGIWSRCGRPWRFAQQYDMGYIEIRDLEAYEPQESAFFSRDDGEAGVSQTVFKRLKITGTTPTYSPFVFGTDANKISKCEIRDCNLNGAPLISFVSVTRAIFDYDHFYYVVSKGTATITAGNISVVVVFGTPLSYAPDVRDVKIMPRTATAWSVTSITSSGFIINIPSALGSNCVFDYATREPLNRYFNGTAM